MPADAADAEPGAADVAEVPRAVEGVAHIVTVNDVPAAAAAIAIAVRGEKGVLQGGVQHLPHLVDKDGLVRELAH